jgi:hypothetical protein
LLAVLPTAQSFAATGTNYLGGDLGSGDVLKVLAASNGGTRPSLWGSTPNDAPAGDQYCNEFTPEAIECWVREYYSQPDGAGLVLYADGELMFWGGNTNANFANYAMQSAPPELVAECTSLADGFDLTAHTIEDFLALYPQCAVLVTGGVSGNVDIEVGTTVRTGNIETISRVWRGKGKADGIVLSEVIFMFKGSYSYNRKVMMINNTGRELHDVRLIIGGDIYFAGDDSGLSGFDANSRAVYGYRDMVSGQMTMSGDSSSPADRYFAGYFVTGAQQALAGNLSNEVEPSHVDNSYYLQWGAAENPVNLPPGGRRTIGLSESFGAPGALQIAPPADQIVEAGQILDLDFSLRNVTSATAGNADPLFVTLSAQSTLGWTVSVTPETMTVNPDGTLPAILHVEVPTGAPRGALDNVIITAEFEGQANEGVAIANVLFGIGTLGLEPVVPPLPPPGGDNDEDLIFAPNTGVLSGLADLQYINWGAVVLGILFGLTVTAAAYIVLRKRMKLRL